MCDRNARDILADALESYLERKTDNDELFRVLWDDAVCQEDTCWEISHEMDLFLSDFNRHKNEGRFRIPDDHEAAVRRWVSLLRSNWNWPAERSDSTPRGMMSALLRLMRTRVFSKAGRLRGNIFWPLRSEDEWKAFVDGVNSQGN